MKNVILKIEGMTCSACSSSLEKYLKKQNGVEDALVNLVMATASISCDDDITIEELNKFVSDAGFKSLGIYDVNLELKKSDKKKSLIVNGILVLIILYISMSNMFNVSLLSKENNPYLYGVILFLFSIYFIFYGRDILLSGLKNIKYKSPNMDTLVMLGVLSSFLFSIYEFVLMLLGNQFSVNCLYFESCCVILYLIKLGRYISDFSKEKMKEAIKDLVVITPKKALILVNDKEIEINIDEVKKGDILVVKPGMRFAVDGSIVEGISHVDESFISGESVPVKKKKGDSVVAGSINLDGVIKYRAKKIGKDSTISEIVRLVVNATNTKAPIQRVTDKVSSYFVPGIIVIAILAFLVNLVLFHELSSAILSLATVLVVACPCALGLATPLAVVVSEGVCAKTGVLVKNSEIFELVNKINTIVFDKTGTLTYGSLKIYKIFNYSNYTNNDIISIVSSLEENSNHPIASAFKNKKNKFKVKGFKNIDGIGVSGIISNKRYLIGNNKLFDKYNISNKYSSDEIDLSNNGSSIIYVIEESNIIALIGVKDVVRNNTKALINKLKSMDKDIIMLTGDNETTAKIIANDIGIDKVYAEVLPKDKAHIIEKLKENGSVMMIGDGINDAPSLAISDIGVSLKNSTDIAGNSASVILMNNDLDGIYYLFDISRNTLLNIKENLFFAFFYNICMIPVAVGALKPFGIYMNPMIAGFAMTISSLTVVLNTLRLKKWRKNNVI